MEQTSGDAYRRKVFSDEAATSVTMSFVTLAGIFSRGLYALRRLHWPADKISQWQRAGYWRDTVFGHRPAKIYDALAGVLSWTTDEDPLQRAMCL